jgi:hypothetical protein
MTNLRPSTVVSRADTVKKLKKTEHSSNSIANKEARLYRKAPVIDELMSEGTTVVSHPSLTALLFLASLSRIHFGFQRHRKCILLTCFIKECQNCLIYANTILWVSHWHTTHSRPQHLYGMFYQKMFLPRSLSTLTLHLTRLPTG